VTRRRVFFWLPLTAGLAGGLAAGLVSGAALSGLAEAALAGLAAGALVGVFWPSRPIRRRRT